MELYEVLEQYGEDKYNTMIEEANSDLHIYTLFDESIEGSLGLIDYDNIISEGANIDIIKVYSDYSKSIKENIKGAKKDIKAKDLSAAKIKLENAKKDISKLKTELANIPEDNLSNIAGLFLAIGFIFCKNIFLIAQFIAIASLKSQDHKIDSKLLDFDNQTIKGIGAVLSGKNPTNILSNIDNLDKELDIRFKVFEGTIMASTIMGVLSILKGLKDFVVKIKVIKNHKDIKPIKTNNQLKMSIDQELLLMIGTIDKLEKALGTPDIKQKLALQKSNIRI